VKTLTSIPADLIPAVGFLANHFSDDIAYSQAGPYEYSDQERDAVMAVIEWTWKAAEQFGCSGCELGSGQPTYHQADELAEYCGDPRQPWPVDTNSTEVNG